MSGFLTLGSLMFLMVAIVRRTGPARIRIARLFPHSFAVRIAGGERSLKRGKGGESVMRRPALEEIARAEIAGLGGVKNFSDGDGPHGGAAHLHGNEHCAFWNGGRNVGVFGRSSGLETGHQGQDIAAFGPKAQCSAPAGRGKGQKPPLRIAVIRHGVRDASSSSANRTGCRAGRPLYRLERRGELESSSRAQRQRFTPAVTPLVSLGRRARRGLAVSSECG